jgi:hypothetical protein
MMRAAVLTYPAVPLKEWSSARTHSLGAPSRDKRTREVILA